VWVLVEYNGGLLCQFVRVRLHITFYKLCNEVLVSIALLGPGVAEDADVGGSRYKHLSNLTVGLRPI